MYAFYKKSAKFYQITNSIEYFLFTFTFRKFWKRWKEVPATSTVIILSHNWIVTFIFHWISWSLGKSFWFYVLETQCIWTL